MYTSQNFAPTHHYISRPHGCTTVTFLKSSVERLEKFKTMQLKSIIHHYVFRSIVALHSFSLKLCSVKYIIMHRPFIMEDSVNNYLGPVQHQLLSSGGDLETGKLRQLVGTGTISPPSANNLSDSCGQDGSEDTERLQQHKQLASIHSS